MMRNVINYGFRDRLASFKSIELGVYDLHKNEEETKRRLTNAAREAIAEDAKVIILGCTVFFGFYKELQEVLGIPVIDPIIAALKYTELLVEVKRTTGWTHSKICQYEPPPEKEIRAWKLEL